MEKIVLNALKRQKDEKAKELRGNLEVPAVMYWPWVQAQAIKVGYSDFLRTYRKAWTNHIISLDIEWAKKDVLIYDMQLDPISWDFAHVDFFAIKKWEKVSVEIPVTLVGQSPAAVEWAVITQVIHEIEVRCLPEHILDKIEVDISKLEKVGNLIHVSDLWLDNAKYEIHADVLSLTIVLAEEVYQEKEEEVAETEAWVEDTTKEVEQAEQQSEQTEEVAE